MGCYLPRVSQRKYNQNCRKSPDVDKRPSVNARVFSHGMCTQFAVLCSFVFRLVLKKNTPDQTTVVFQTRTLLFRPSEESCIVVPLGHPGGACWGGSVVAFVQTKRILFVLRLKYSTDLSFCLTLLTNALLEAGFFTSFGVIFPGLLCSEPQVL